MDSMRSVLMMLGVVLHSCNVYSSEQSWIIFSDRTTVFADYLNTAIHVFRMPSFFAVSGFFFAYTIGKYSPTKFIRVRLARIVVPLVVTAVTLNSLQALILNITGYRSYSIREYFCQGAWISHLWFLINLIVYFILSYAMVFLFKNLLTLVLNGARKLFSSLPILGLLALAPLSHLAILAAGKAGFPLYANLFHVFSVSSIISYLPYFAFGCILGAEVDLLKRFVETPIFFTIGVISFAALLAWRGNFDNSLVMTTLHEYIHYLIVWLSILLCFSMFFKFFNRSTPLWLFLSDASYTVYLFHHVIVVGSGYLLIQLGTPPIPSILILIASTALGTLVIHKHVILRSMLARFLFNGK